MRKTLPPSWFSRRGEKLARSLIGKYLVRRIGGNEVALMVNEVELYEGREDKSSHAYKGNKGRAAVMFGPGGHWYVYRCYGIYEMLNLVIGKEGFPAAVLIRGAGPYHGPGKLTKALGITRAENGKPAAKATGLWLEDRGAKVAAKEIEAGPRVGLGADAGEWAKKPHRFVLRTR